MQTADVKLGIVVGLLLSAAIVSTNVLLPLLLGHAIPDTELTESAGWLLMFGAVCGIGFVRVQRSSSARDSAIAGAIVSFLGFGIAMATFLVIDNLFIGIVSQQPEKIWLFQHSGYTDMRTYLNHTNVRAFWTVLPLLSLFGAICGGLGGFLSLLVRRTAV